MRRTGGKRSFFFGFVFWASIVVHLDEAPAGIKSSPWGGEVRNSRRACAMARFGGKCFRSIQEFNGVDCGSRALVLRVPVHGDFPTVIGEVKRAPTGERRQPVHRRLVLTVVVIVRWPRVLDVFFFIMFELLCNFDELL